MRRRATYNPDPVRIRRCYLSGIMTDAWHTAHSASGQFGGRPVQYIPGSLCMAWQKTKADAGAWNTAGLMADFRPV